MARRNSGSAASTTDAPKGDDFNTPVESTETPAAPAAETAPVEIDLTGFQSAVQTALDERDTSTGDLPKDQLEAVNKVYRELDGGVKAKNAARSWIDDQMKLAISGDPSTGTKGDIVLAKAFVMLKDNLSAGSGASTPKPPADPTTAFVQRVAALSIASTLVSSNVPEGVSEDWSAKSEALVTELSEQVDKYNAWASDTSEDKGEAPEVSPVVRQAFKLASGKSVGGGSGRAAGGPRRDIEKHMAQVFEGLESGGFLTVNEIAKAQSTEYGDDRPSAGAVSARLFPKGKDAYVGETLKAVADEGKSRGAVKI